MRKISLLAASALVAMTAGAQNYNLMVTKSNGTTVKIPTNEISKIEFVEQQGTYHSKGDLLDIEFLADGTAVDHSPMQHKVITSAGSSLMTYYSDLHGRYVANFRNTMGETVTSGYYRVNYTKGGDFINRIADGCTMETIIKLNEPDAPGKEVKWFSSMQAGGIGFILPIHGANPGTRCFTFLPNISTTGSSTWRWCYSDVEPVPGNYYHIVGVYNKQEGRSYIYVNGRLSGTLDTPGSYVPVQSGAESFVIGGDPSTNQTNCDSSFNGEVVSVRIYDDPMDAAEVAELWADEAFEQPQSEYIAVSDLKYLAECELAPGYKYSFYGKGFANGDVVELQNGATAIEAATKVDGDRVTITIPANLQSGSYKLILKRGDLKTPLFMATFSVVASSPATPKASKVIAHRGAHTDGASENSVAALSKAMDLNYYGIELDVWITTDGQLVVHHDGVVNGTYFQNTTYDKIKDIKLGNGEYLPTFDSFVNKFKSKMGTSSSKLIIEIKTHSDINRLYAAVDRVMKMVKDEGLTDRVEYIAFSYDACKRIVANDPNAMVGYLSGNLAPSVILKDGIRSIDYSYIVLGNNPQWIKEANDLGMTTNVWTVNTASEMLRYMSLGADYITTDAPAVLEELTKLTFVEE